MIYNIQPYSVSNKASITAKKKNFPFKNSGAGIISNADQKDNMGAVWTSGIGLVVFSIICGALMFSRGVQKSSIKSLNKIKEYLENKSESSFSNESNGKTKFYEYSIRRINSFLRKSESINNITSVKDILFMKLMYKTEPTKKLHDAISNYFQKLSQKTVTNSYLITEKNFKKMNSIFDKLDTAILKESSNEIVEYGGKKYTTRELIEIAKGYRENALLAINAFISKNGQEARCEYMNNATSSLYSKFWDLSFSGFWTKNNKFKRKEMWQTFIAAEQIKGNKTELTKNINYLKEIIAYSDAYRENLIIGNLKELRTTIPVFDTDGMVLLERLECLLKNPQNIAKNKEKLLKELDKIEKHKTSSKIDEEVSSVQENYKQTCIDIIRNQINESSPGDFQKMLSIYNEIAPYEIEKSKALYALRNSVDSLDNSIRLESVELFDKIRDLKLGSAPTDVLTILISFFAISFGLGRADNNKERRSIMLKSGIPIAGAIATSVISATKLVSGGKSILFGILSGIILNKFGIITDRIVKHYESDKKTNA